MLVVNAREKRRDASRAQSIDTVPACLQTISALLPEDDDASKLASKPSPSCPLYPQPQQRSHAEEQERHRKPDHRPIRDPCSSDARHARITAARVTAVNRALASGRTTQVVYFGLGDDVMQFLQSPATPPPVTLYLVDHVSEQSLSDAPPESEASPAFEYPLLPDDVRVVRIRTDLRDHVWDSHVVQAGYYWQQRSAWVVNLDASASHFSSTHVLDTFLRMVHNLITPLSAIIITYSTCTTSGEDAGVEAGGDEEDDAVKEDTSLGLKFSSASFAHFVRQRRFRVLHDNPVEGDEDCGPDDENKENNQHDETGTDKVRIATLIHANARTSTRSTSLDVIHDALAESCDDMFGEDLADGWCNMTDAQTNAQDFEGKPNDDDSQTPEDTQTQEKEASPPDEPSEDTPVENEKCNKSEHGPGQNQGSESESVPVSESQSEEEPRQDIDARADVEEDEGEKVQERPGEEPTEMRTRVQAGADAESSGSAEDAEEANETVIEFRLDMESLQCDRTKDAAHAIVIGSIAAVGEWDAERAVKLEGDLWNDETLFLQACVNVPQHVQSFEYKYALIDSSQSIVVWEQGANRSVNLADDMDERGGDNTGTHVGQGKCAVLRSESWRH